LVLEFRQFLLWRNPTSPATTIPKKKKLESRQIKIECVVARRGRNGTAEAEEHAFQRVLERMLSRDGIRRGAYDYISHYCTLGACHIICFENRFGLGTINTPE
jgi:hypothetical protein